MNLASGGFVYIYDSVTGNALWSFVFIVSREKSEQGNRKCGPANIDNFFNFGPIFLKFSPKCRV